MFVALGATLSEMLFKIKNTKKCRWKGLKHQYMQLHCFRIKKLNMDVNYAFISIQFISSA